MPRIRRLLGLESPISDLCFYCPLKFFIFSFQLSEAAHARLRKAQSRRRINKDTKSALAKWLKQLQFKMALAEQQPDGSLFI